MSDTKREWRTLGNPDAYAQGKVYDFMRTYNVGYGNAPIFILNLAARYFYHLGEGTVLHVKDRFNRSKDLEGNL